jgi:hypothetical protein
MWQQTLSLYYLPPQSEPVVNLDNDNLDDELLDELSSHSASAGNSRENPGPSDFDHPQAINKATPKQKLQVDHWQWTRRWLLLLDDSPIPEWNLEDEVAVIASRVVKSRPI